MLKIVMKTDEKGSDYTHQCTGDAARLWCDVVPEAALLADGKRGDFETLNEDDGQYVLLDSMRIADRYAVSYEQYVTAEAKRTNTSIDAVRAREAGPDAHAAIFGLPQFVRAQNARGHRPRLRFETVEG